MIMQIAYQRRSTTLLVKGKGRISSFADQYTNNRQEIEDAGHGWKSHDPSIHQGSLGQDGAAGLSATNTAVETCKCNMIPRVEYLSFSLDDYGSNNPAA